jgi:thiamine biosynthesis lipoprotein
MQISVVAWFASLVLMTASGRVAPVTREVFLMGTRATLTTWDRDRPLALRHLESLLQPLEQTERQLSTWMPDSEVSRLNRATSRMSLSPALCVLLADVERWTHETAGTFDPSIGALTSEWGIHEGGRLPTDAQIADALSHSGWNHVSLDRSTCEVELTRGVTLDVGAFGKGAALDRARQAVPHTIPWMIDLGGQVAVNGAPPGTTGWTVFIADPQRRTTPALEVVLTGGSLSTSAGSERDVHVNGRRVSHHIDPRTGRPAAFDGSVTVWHEQALAADALSTALYVMGVREGLRWAHEHDVAACYLLRDGRVRASPAFRRRFPTPERFK